MIPVVSPLSTKGSPRSSVRSAGLKRWKKRSGRPIPPTAPSNAESATRVGPRTDGRAKSIPTLTAIVRADSYVAHKIVGMGTSLHAAQVGKFMIESLARVPVEVDNSSEFRYRDPIITPKSLVIGISQSGETADTLAAMKEAREKGAPLLSICNVVGSQAARQSDAVLYTHAGPEIGVASTKAFTTQLAALYLLALELAQSRRVLPERSEEHTSELQSPFLI